MAILLRLKRSATTGSVPVTTSAAQAGEVLVNTTDRKIFVRNSSGVAIAVADRITDHSSTKVYKTDDLVIYQFNLWQCKADIPAGAFNSAQWDQIGAAGTAILQLPEGVNTNTIDTASLPTANALTISAPSSQTGWLQKWVVANPNDGRFASIDAFGFPNARLGPVIQRITQAGHGFSFVGQVLAHTSAGWILANGANVNHVPLGIVEQVIDANTFVIRYSGAVASLNVGAFATGVIASNTRYFLSATVPGQLTTVAPTSNATLVLATVSVTSGVMVLAQSGAASLALTGGTMTGDINFASTRGLTFTTAATAIRQQGASGPALDVFINSALAARFDPAGTITTGSQVVVTVEKGDARYVNLTGDTVTGQINGIAPTAAANLTRKDYVDAQVALKLSLTGGTLTGQVNGITPTANANLTRKDYVDAQVATRLTQAQGDARYVNLTGDTVTGQINGITPTAAANLTRKDYVDAQVATRLTQAQGDARYVAQADIIFGGVTGGGVKSFGSGFTCAQISTGRYRITFTTPRPDTNYAVLATPGNQSNSPVGENIGLNAYNKTTASFDVESNNVGNSTNNVGFNFFVIG